MSSRADDRVRITADDRERAAGVIEALGAMEDVELSIGRLSLGDYVVENGLLVERKTVLDLGLSILDGRLFRQVGRLARAPAMRPCLIVEGAAEEFDQAAVSRLSLQGALITATLMYGLPILYSSDPGETARLLRIAARQLRRREARGPERFCSKIGSDRRLRMLMLARVSHQLSTAAGDVPHSAVLSRLGVLDVP